MFFEYISKYVAEASASAGLAFFFSMDKLTSVPRSQANNLLKSRENRFCALPCFGRSFHSV